MQFGKGNVTFSANRIDCNIINQHLQPMQVIDKIVSSSLKICYARIQNSQPVELKPPAHLVSGNDSEAKPILTNYQNYP